MDTIFRSQTETEKNLTEGGFKDIMFNDWKKEDIRQKALARIAEVEYTTIYQKRQPYCAKCAQNMVEKKIDEVEVLIKKARSSKNKSVKADVSINFEQFAGETNLEKIGEVEIQEDMIIQGLKQRVATGIYKEYECKLCGSKIAFEIRNKELETSKLEVPEGKLRAIR